MEMNHTHPPFPKTAAGGPVGNVNGSSRSSARRQEMPKGASQAVARRARRFLATARSAGTAAAFPPWNTSLSGVKSRPLLNWSAA